MAGKFIAKIATPAVAALALGVSAALAAGFGFEDGAPAYKDAMTRYEIDDARTNASKIFTRADIDENGVLDSDEYTALSIVIAELSRLNGFLSFETANGVQLVTLPISAPGALTLGERARVEAVARGEFYVTAGEDGLIEEGEFIGEKLSRFEAADRNRNGALTKRELVSFATVEARISSSKA